MWSYLRLVPRPLTLFIMRLERGMFNRLICRLRKSKECALLNMLSSNEFCPFAPKSRHLSQRYGHVLASVIPHAFLPCVCPYVYAIYIAFLNHGPRHRQLVTRLFRALWRRRTRAPCSASYLPFSFSSQSRYLRCHVTFSVYRILTQPLHHAIQQVRLLTQMSQQYQ